MIKDRTAPTIVFVIELGSPSPRCPAPFQALGTSYMIKRYESGEFNAANETTQAQAVTLKHVNINAPRHHGIHGQSGRYSFKVLQALEAWQNIITHHRICTAEELDTHDPEGFQA